MHIELTTNARRRLVQLIDHHRSEGNPRKGTRTVRTIIKQVRKLSQHPKLGQVEEYLIREEKGHRYLLVERIYKVIYLVHASRIVITDVFDVRQDPSKIRG
ncbi:MAG: type II toxin-antitoxin system RelE/ParE family toxin [Saprospiraceae bacterium]